MPYKLILADDHQFLIQGVLTVLKDVADIEVVDTAVNGVELMSKMATLRPDLVVLDLNMPGYDGLECLSRIKAGFASTKVLVLSNYNQPQLLEEVKKAGADGYLIKNSTAAELKGAIAGILAGDKVFASDKSLMELPDESYFFDGFLKKYKLTRREVDVIRMVVLGKSTKEMATACSLSELTISTHRRNIFRKLDLKNVAGLVNFAKENGIT